MAKPLEPIGTYKTRWSSFHRKHDRSATWYTGELVNHRTGEVYIPPSRTKQSFVAECDINNIIKTFKISGQITHMSAQAQKGSYQDLPEPQDFQESMNLVIAAQKAFATLPSQVRQRFGNDPAQFLGFMSDPANQDEMIKLGLATDTRPPPIPAAEPAGETAPTGSPGPANT